MENNRSFCPECELKAASMAVTKESILEQVSGMAFVEGVTTPEIQYRKRLEICESCDRLSSGIMCSVSGSYVAFRAKLIKNKCPFVGRDKWNEI